MRNDDIIVAMDFIAENGHKLTRPDSAFYYLLGAFEYLKTKLCFLRHHKYLDALAAEAQSQIVTVEFTYCAKKLSEAIRDGHFSSAISKEILRCCLLAFSYGKPRGTAGRCLWRFVRRI